LEEKQKEIICCTERRVAHSPLIFFITFPIMPALCDPFYHSYLSTTCIHFPLFPSLKTTVKSCRGHSCPTSAQSGLTQDQPLTKPASLQLARVKFQDLLDSHNTCSFLYRMSELRNIFKRFIQKFCHHLLKLM